MTEDFGNLGVVLVSARVFVLIGHIPRRRTTLGGSFAFSFSFRHYEVSGLLRLCSTAFVVYCVCAWVLTEFRYSVNIISVPI